MFLARLVRTFFALTVFASTVSAGERDHIVFQLIRRGDADALDRQLSQGTPVELTSADGTTALTYAALRGNADTVKVLLRHGADPNRANKAGVTPLIWSVHDPDKVTALLKSGAKPDHRSKLGNTALITAAAIPDSVATIDALLKAGADAKLTNNRRYTALHNAVFCGDLKTLNRLLQHTPDLIKKAENPSCLNLAASRGHVSLVKRLLELGVKVNSGGRGPLNQALLAQRTDIAHMLLEKKVALDRTISPGNVPSIVLAAYNEFEDTSVAKRLIELGVNLDAKNTYDENAIDWARKRGNETLIKLLISSGAKETTPKKRVKIPSREIPEGQVAREKLIRTSIQKSIDLMQGSSDSFLEQRESCVSCHHQNLPSIALGVAHDRGFNVNQASVTRMIDGQLRSWRPRIDRAYQLDRPVPVEPRFIGYGLLGFGSLGYRSDEVTDAMVWYLAQIQQPDGHWVPGMLRPPLGGGEVVATVLGMRSLQLYTLEGRESEFEQRIDRAKNFLIKSKPRIHQEQTVRLLGLAWAGVDNVKLVTAIDHLFAEQRKDGGWAQLKTLKSDAWATGQTLVALRTAGVKPTDERYQRGVEFLLKTQFDDGSWYVQHRTWPFQTHFESKFPHGRDQWVSMPATAWATWALTLSVPPQTATVPRHDDTVQPDAKADTPPIASKPAASKKVIAITLPKPGETVSYSKHIRPILQRSCVSCHSGKNAKGGYRMSSRKDFIKGGESGDAAVVLGKNVGKSPLLRFVTDQVEDLEMPPLAERKKFPPLSKDEVAALKRWIEQGAKWEK